MAPRIRHLRVRIKELASEAGHIRHESNQCAGLEKWTLNHHRTSVVRPAARAYQLAYAMARGRAYARCERSVRDVDQAAIALTRAAKYARSFGVRPDYIEQWLLSAAAHLDGVNEEVAVRLTG